MPHLQTSSQPRVDLGFGGYSCNYGVHLCGLYETEQEREEIMLGFLNKGCVEGDFQLCCDGHDTPVEFIQSYSRHFPDSADALFDPEIFQIISARDLYYPDGTFSPHAMDEGLEAFFQASQLKGPRNIRATANMSWAHKTIPGIQNLMVYESRLNYFIPGKPWVSICLYDINKFSGSTIMQVLQTHPYTISGGLITENPFYRDPDIWLKQYAPEFLKT